ncbi:FAD:protein FMN transferase [Clostridium cibarium]
MTMELLFLILIISILFLIFFTKNKPNIVSEKSYYILGTLINLKVFGKESEKAIDEAIERLIDIDNKMSAFKESSEISKINKNAGIALQTVSNETFSLIDKSISYSELSEGAFDPTIRPLVSLWGIGTKSERVPTEIEINDNLKLVNYRDIILNKDDNSIGLKKQNQSIDLGGIAKGYAADEVVNIFLKHGIKSAIIDLGGNIFVLGNKNNESFWNVGIQNPFMPRGEHIGILSLKDKSIVTSGNYERFFIKDNKAFHHIIDPKTGYPSSSNVISATIISDNSIDGDGLSTGVYIMGLDKALDLIESIKGVDAIFITNDKNVFVTSGIRHNFKLSNTEFIYNNN